MVHFWAAVLQHNDTGEETYCTQRTTLNIGVIAKGAETRSLSRKWKIYRRLTSHTCWLWILIGSCSARVRAAKGVELPGVRKKKLRHIFQADFHIFSIKALYIYQWCKVYRFPNANALRSRHLEMCSKKNNLTEINEFMMDFVILYSFCSEKNMNSL